jgi:gluconate 5-dehydrogenase
MLKMFDLSGKRALVTGSSTGIGFALARGLASAGATVVLNGRNEARLAEAVERLRAEGMSVDAMSFDVTSPS